jgi:poly(hydroxyalkanoate) depolymerase family esterase
MPQSNRRASRSLRLALTRGSSLVFMTAMFAASPSFAAQWQNKVSWGGSMGMDMYVPDKVDASPGVVVSLHYCGGMSSNAHGWFQSAADQYGFIIIAPQAGGNCFDAKPERSGERDSITKMVKYVLTQKSGDATRVFVAGASSGACMSEALVAAYPDVFAAGSVLAGVPAGAWTGGNAYGWTTPDNRSAQQWGDIVRNADPGFNGARPRLQLWHGTADTTLNYMPNFPAEVAQWTNVFGVSDANATKSSFKASADTWARTSYKNGSGTVVLETNVADGAPHDLSGRGLWGDVVRFFGLDQDATSGGGTGSGGSGAGGASAGGSANGGSGGASAGGKTGNTGGNGTAGSGNGGANSAGSSNGGASAAGQSSGGVSAGGSMNSSGGASAGGSMNSGGGASSGGSNKGLGGSALGFGGQSAGGGVSSGGATTGTGGASMSGGSSGNGCSCTLPGGAQRPMSGLAALAALGLGTLLRRRKKTR